MVVPDLQIPYHDKRYVDKLLRVAEEHQPDVLVGIGDWMDFPEVSRWTKDLAGEFEPTLQKSIDVGRSYWAAFRDVCPDARLIWKTGNHDERIEDYVKRYAPALWSLRSSRLEDLFDLEPLQVEVHRRPVLLGKGLLLVMHGHEEAYSTVPGKWGLEQVKKQGVSVVYGHTHQPILATHTVGGGAKSKTFFAMNVGHGCDPKKMHYAKSGYFNWCRAFGWIEVHKSNVQPSLVTSLNGSVRFLGKDY